MNLAVHYICALCSHHPQTLDAQKLHRILWLADGRSYASLGKAIVGEEYTRGSHGPTAVHLDAALRHLEQEGHLSVRAFGGRQEYLATRVPDVSSLSADERRILDQIIREVTEDESRVADSVKPGSWVSHAYEKSFERSFEHTWEVAEPGEAIPYSQCALLKFLPLTPEDENWIRSELENLK
jgi:hypothetical protein